jgi:hypothetical protein
MRLRGIDADRRAGRELSGDVEAGREAFRQISLRLSGAWRGAKIMT